MKIKTKKPFGAKHRRQNETLTEYTKRLRAEVKSALQLAKETMLRPRSEEEYDALVFALKFFVEELRNDGNEVSVDRVRSIEAMLGRAGIQI